MSNTMESSCLRFSRSSTMFHISLTCYYHEEQEGWERDGRPVQSVNLQWQKDGHHSPGLDRAEHCCGCKMLQQHWRASKRWSAVISWGQALLVQVFKHIQAVFGLHQAATEPSMSWKMLELEIAWWKKLHMLLEDWRSGSPIRMISDIDQGWGSMHFWTTRDGIWVKWLNWKNRKTWWHIHVLRNCCVIVHEMWNLFRHDGFTFEWR